jgi:asparagine synthase (glutamine-hydrolysing)
MSGYAAIVRFDGRPIDPGLVNSLSESIRFRGPERASVWIGDQAAFVHALMQLSSHQANEQQPVRLGGTVIAGDVRIDGREDFVAALRASGARVETQTPDSELLLHAWAAWGEGLLERLIGDFSFAIWDGAERRLFCARDQFARRPAFFATVDGALCITNNLPTLTSIPGLATELDEAAVADFLLFGRNLHAERTTFARISRIPAAHALIVTASGITLRRYWTLPMRDEPRKVSEGAAHEEFREVMTKAVMDRSHADRLVISLSGGLDSNTIAATLTRRRTAGVSALTTVWNELFDDEEGRYARIGAESYGIPIEYHVADRCDAFEGWDDPLLRGLEPTDEPCTKLFHGFVARAAAKGRVILTGEGGDPALYTSHDHFFRLLKRFHWLRFLRESAGYAISRRKRPPLLLRSQLLKALGRPRVIPRYPEWMDPDLEARLGLRERWFEIYGAPEVPVHPYRTEAWDLLQSPTWARTFEANDAGATRQLLEWRSPYFDVRLLEFLFSLPPMPHFANKDIARVGMKGWIPEKVRLRKKTPLPLDPSALQFERSVKPWIATVESADDMARFVDRRKLCGAMLASEGSQYYRSQQAYGVSLELWLRNRNLS